VRSCNRGCLEQTISITYSECVFLALVIRHEKRMRLLWLVWLYHIFPRYLINGKIFRKNELNIKCVLIFSTLPVWNMFLIARRIKRDIVTNIHKSYVKCRYSCQILMELQFSRQIFEKRWTVKLHENPSRGSRVDPYGRTDRETWRSK